MKIHNMFFGNARVGNIIAGKPGQPSFTDALRNELVVEAARGSARSDDWVEPGELAG